MVSNANRRVVLAAGLTAMLGSQAVKANPDLLPPSQAFQMRAGPRIGQTLEMQFLAAPGYYLYADQFRFETDSPAVRVTAVQLPPGQTKWDEEFGKQVTYFRGLVRVKLTLEGPAMALTLTARAQGCADVGVCYPPVVTTFVVAGENS